MNSRRNFPGPLRIGGLWGLYPQRPLGPEARARQLLYLHRYLSTAAWKHRCADIMPPLLRLVLTL
eukprot:4737379-Pyramimonas_sp.AAC.2